MPDEIAPDFSAQQSLDWTLALAQEAAMRSLCEMYGEFVIKAAWDCGYTNGALGAIKVLEYRIKAAKP